jgi:hypothetical protein
LIGFFYDDLSNRKGVAAMKAPKFSDAQNAFIFKGAKIMRRLQKSAATPASA